MINDYSLEIITNPLFEPFVNTFTLLVALLTALAALRSSRAANEANEIRLLPILNIYFTDTRSSDYSFFLKNLGEGPAFDVQISPWYVLLEDLGQVWELRMELENTNLVEPKEKILISYHSTVDGKEVNVAKIMAAHLLPDTSSKLPRIKLNITFLNAVGHKYFTIVELGKGGPKVLTPARRLNWIMAIKFLINDSFNYMNRGWFYCLWKFKTSRQKKS